MFSFLTRKLKEGLAKTRGLFAGLAQLVGLKGKVDEKFMAELEQRLYTADLGTTATTAICERVRAAFFDKEIGGDVDVMSFVKAELKRLLSAENININFASSGPTVILVAGVNGSGKTTSIAKLAFRLQSEGRKVMVAAGDTFRAAAVEQLTIWSQRIGCTIVKNQQGSNASAVVHDACEKAKAGGFDVVIVDTAGRLHTQAHLMSELQKLHRVIQKQIPGAPHEVLLVLDATTGQNAIIQAEHFKKAVQCTGIILSKLDGTAKGGAVFGVKSKLNLPVKLVGVGEKLEDMEPFDPESYVEALFE